MEWLSRQPSWCQDHWSAGRSQPLKIMYSKGPHRFLTFKKHTDFWLIGLCNCILFIVFVYTMNTREWIETLLCRMEIKRREVKRREVKRMEMRERKWAKYALLFDGLIAISSSVHLKMPSIIIIWQHKVKGVALLTEDHTSKEDSYIRFDSWISLDSQYTLIFFIKNWFHQKGNNVSATTLATYPRLDKDTQQVDDFNDHVR